MTANGEIEVFQEAEILELFRQSLIDFAKTSASCSAICQAYDASPLFRAVKKSLVHYAVTFDPCQDEGNDDVADQLSDFIGAIFAANKKSVVIKSLLKVVGAIRETLAMKFLKNGFAITSQYPIHFGKAMNSMFHHERSQQRAIPIDERQRENTGKHLEDILNLL